MKYAGYVSTNVDTNIVHEVREWFIANPFSAAVVIIFTIGFGILTSCVLSANGDRILEKYANDPVVVHARSIE